MTNEEKIAELIKVSKMPLEERNAYIEQSIAKKEREAQLAEYQRIIMYISTNIFCIFA